VVCPCVCLPDDNRPRDALARVAKRRTGRAHDEPADWTVPQVGALPDDDHGRLVRRGRDLITATYAYIGPQVSDAARRYAGNNLACSNCHLEAGTKKFAIPIFGLFEEFPRYNARLARISHTI